MRNVVDKSSSFRTAKARAVIKVASETMVTIREGRVPKGDPLPVARIAAIQAVKNTPQLIPYCHTVPIDFVGVEFELGDDQISISVEVQSVYKTGVEMEAMAGAMVGALNLYDVLKMIDDTMEVSSVQLVHKTGGKSAIRRATDWSFAVIVVSDRVSRGEAQDQSGQVLRDGLTAHGGQCVQSLVVADGVEEVRGACQHLCQSGCDLLVLTGGTGMGPRDFTPEAVAPLFEKELPGVVEHLRNHALSRTPYAMFGRIQAGVVGNTVIIALPGSVGAVQDAINALFPYLTHGFEVLRGGGH